MEFLCENSYTFFFISNTLTSNTELILAKNQANAMQHPEAELLLFRNYSHSSLTLSSKNNWTYSENIRKWTIASVFIRLIIIKIKMKMKNRSQRYDINRPRSTHGHKYIKYKKCLSMMILICIKQHLSNIWSSIQEEVKQHWGLSWKKALLIKKSVLTFFSKPDQIQKQQPTRASWKNHSERYWKIQRKTPVMESFSVKL